MPTSEKTKNKCNMKVFSNKKQIIKYTKINTKIQSQATVPYFVFPTFWHSVSDYENKFSLVTH